MKCHVQIRFYLYQTNIYTALSIFLFRLKSLYIFIAILFSVLTAVCQQRPFYFKNYQVQNGLSSNIITAITQDRKGFMWFGSRNGLNRFDGTSFKIFQNKPSDKHSIGSNSIFSLYEDAAEQLWVGTYKGIYIYSPREESFTPFKKIPPGEVRYIRGDGQHHIWIISDLTLYRYDERSHDITSYRLNNDYTITLHLEASGVLWAATINGYIKKYTPGQKVITYDISAANHHRKFSSIQEIYPVGDTELIVGTMNQAVRYNYKKNTVSSLFHQPEIKDVHTHAIHYQGGGEYWLGTEAGLYIFDLTGSNVVHVQKQYSNPYDLTDNIISSIYKDREGGTWLGTYFGGINYYSQPYNNFRKYFPQPGINSLSGNIIHEICKDQYNQLWVGTEDAGLNQLDIKTGRITHYLPQHGPGHIAYRNIHGLCADGDKLWIGTYEHGLDVMDLKTHRIIKHYDAAKNATSFTSDFIVTLYKNHKGEILVGTWTGLFKYNKQKDNFMALPFSNIPIQSLREDENGTLWISSYGGGVYYYNENTGKKGHLTYLSGKQNGLINNYVNGIFEDKNKQFWFTTEGGLSKYDPRLNRFTNYTVEEGLPDNQVFRILEDQTGTLWISTAKGLASFNPAANKFTAYHAANGLPTEQFNYNSSFEDADGTMYFGTVKGMVSFTPSKFAKNTYVPPVFVTGIQANNNELVINDKRSDLRQAITYVRNITLPYDYANLSIDVAALSYMIPEINRYTYKMEGIDKNWITLKNNRKIYYTKLSPGQYTFRVKGSNSEGIWNPKETTLNIKVLPPLWATWWAYTFYALIVFLIAITILRYYHLAVSEKNKRLIENIEINTEREIYNAKIEFFTNIAHEIRTPLTLIKMPLDKLLNCGMYDRQTNESLTMINKNTNRLINLTDQLLDFRKAEANRFSLSFTKTDINELLTEVYTDFKSMADQKGIAYKLDLPRLTLHAYVDLEALKKILSNLFNNAIKYAVETVRVKLLPFSSEDTSFHIEIWNDGFLIPQDLHQKIFEPFYRIKETEKEAGTGIGLPLSRSLAQLHGGNIELRSAEEKLNIFLLTLPIHQERELDLKAEEEDTADEQDSQFLPADNEYRLRPTILLVEDNKEILHYIQHELSSKYHIFKATNGQEALQILQKENVQLVVSDIMMPVMDGIELCKKVKSDLQYSHVPIILLTAKNSIHSKIEGLEVGADAYIEKPFSFEHLLAQISNLLSNRNLMKEYFAHSPLTHMKGIACSKADKDFLEHLNKTIYDHITDTELDVDQLSALMNMSRPTLYRKIKGLSDLTPNELINLSRLKKAAELLAEGNYKINEVANLIGYSLPTNFSRDFQKQFGVSPSNYILNLKEANKEI